MPTQFPVHGQWWSILITHFPHTLQWCVLGGLMLLHFLQSLNDLKVLFLSQISTTYLVTESSAGSIKPISISVLGWFIESILFFYLISSAFYAFKSIISNLIFILYELILSMGSPSSTVWLSYSFFSSSVIVFATGPPPYAASSYPSSAGIIYNILVLKCVSTNPGSWNITRQ